MMIFMVVQKAEPGHNTSYKTGTTWLKSHDTQAAAAKQAAEYNHYRSEQCVGVTYEVVGPVDETNNDFSR